MWVSNPSELAPGMVVFKWHDSGALGPQPMFAEVIRVNRVTATIEYLRSGLRFRVPFHELNLIADQSEAELHRQEAREVREKYANG